MNKAWNAPYAGTQGSQGMGGQQQQFSGMNGMGNNMQKPYFQPNIQHQMP